MSIDRFPIEAGHIMMFARAIGDENAAYYAALHGDAEAALAPPTFVQAAAQFDTSYFLRPVIGKPWFGSGKTPSGGAMPAPTSDDKDDGGGGPPLHAEQHFEFHRHPRAGDVLVATTTPGKTWEKQGRRGGKLLFAESITEFRDETGELVITASAIGVRTERPAGED